MFVNTGHVAIIESGPFQSWFIEPKAKWMYQVQSSPGIGTKPDHVAGVRRDFGLIGDQICRRMGLKLAAGKSVAAAQEEIGQVVEGVQAARAVRQVAQRLGVEMPIAEQVYRVLYEDEPAEKAVYTLMTRQLRSEI